MHVALLACSLPLLLLAAPALAQQPAAPAAPPPAAPTSPAAPPPAAPGPPAAPAPAAPGPSALPAAPPPAVPSPYPPMAPGPYFYPVPYYYPLPPPPPAPVKPARPLGAWQDRPLALVGRIGLGAPWGLLGTSLDYALTPGFSLEAGVGKGIHGTNLDTMAHLRLTRWENFALSIGAGLSTGAYASVGSFGDEDPNERWERAFWGNAEFALEKRSASGFVISGRFGLGALLNPGAGTCSDRYNHCSKAETVLPYAGLTLGYAFEL